MNKLVSFFIAFLVLITSHNAGAVDQNVCEEGKTVVLHENGAVASCHLSEVYNTNGVQCNNRKATFYNNGSLESCELATATNVDGTNCDQTGVIVFYPDGRLKSCRTAS
ncbi:MAG TPA: hypothetical protein VHO84_06165 [Syntrophorhabdaceae bacterium]|nr:hypothetical protein [Syntrophorhabdaceae bacterium]